MTYASHFESPLGLIELTANDTGLTSLYFVDKAKHKEHNHPILEQTKTQLHGYFNHELTDFNVPLAAVGTDFQQQVWQALCGIGCGQTASYAELATKIGNPKAVRAVGAANGKNPISIIVPCHRVIGSNGTLTGYAGGLKRKAWLLQHEASQMFR